MKTLAELEAESLEGFRNPERTPAQEALSREIRATKRAYEEANTPLDDGLEDSEEGTEE